MRVASCGTQITWRARLRNVTGLILPRPAVTQRLEVLGQANRLPSTELHKVLRPSPSCAAGGWRYREHSQLAALHELRHGSPTNPLAQLHVSINDEPAQISFGGSAESEGICRGYQPQIPCNCASVPCMRLKLQCGGHVSRCAWRCFLTQRTTLRGSNNFPPALGV